MSSNTFSNRVTKLLGVKYPIICGGMHYVGYAQLAAAVSNAGGLGVITALTQTSAENLRKEIKKCKSLTDKPFGVNVTLLPALKPPDYPSYAKVIIEEKIPVVETAGRNPEEWIKLFKSHNIVVIHKCVAIRHALTAQRLGADIISMDGFECGGHPGEAIVGNWILLPGAFEKLKIPFIASGGCCNGRQLAAALALGAEGINMGTRFMATMEAPIHNNIKQAIVNGDELSTTHIMQTLKNTERVFKNETALKIQEIEKEKPGNIGAIYQYVRGENYRKSFQESGDTTSSVWSCGQGLNLIHDIPTCKDLIDTIMKDALDILTKKIPSTIITTSKL